MFAEKIINWYHENGRDLPWRNTDDPYCIWLSEIILQQTRIEQGLVYYHHFIHEYPTVQHLAAATTEQVLKSWQGLGYYSRARNLHAAARHIAYDLDGIFPDTYKDILSLKGHRLICLQAPLPRHRRECLPVHLPSIWNPHPHRHACRLPRVRNTLGQTYRQGTTRPVQPSHYGLRLHLLQTN